MTDNQLLLISLWIHPMSEKIPNVIYAIPDIPEDFDRTTCTPAMSLRQALHEATPGTEIRLLPGTFNRKIRVANRQGTEDAPIVIQGDDLNTTIDGSMHPGEQAADCRGAWPMDIRRRGEDLWIHKWNFAIIRLIRRLFEWLIGLYIQQRWNRGRRAPFFNLSDCSWIEWRNVHFANCWPYAIRVTGSHHLSVACCKIIGSTYFFYMDDHGRKDPSHHILLEGNTWRQDPTGPKDPEAVCPCNQQSWTCWTWWEMKTPRKDDRDLRFMNGGFVGGRDMAGSLIIRNNTMRFAFNAIRIEVIYDETEEEPLRHNDRVYVPNSADVDVTYRKPHRHRNTNVEIYGNTIEYIRDNAIEPEHSSLNWWVHHNKFKNVHKIFSIHNNGGGFWYFFSNTGSTEAVPPAQVAEWENKPNGRDKPSKLGGKIFKFFYGPPLPDLPCFAFHNSWRPRGGVLTGGESRYFRHYNNAIQHCSPVNPCELYCADRKAFSESYNYAFATKLEPQYHDAHPLLDNDVSDGEDFPCEAREHGVELNGRQASANVFDPSECAPFELHRDSPARDGATTIELHARKDWPADEDWRSDAPDCGAVQPDGDFAGPAFAHLHNPLYREAPRLVAVEKVKNQVGVPPNKLHLVFSVTLDRNSYSSNQHRLELRFDNGPPVVATICEISGRRVVVTLPGAMPAGQVTSLELPKGLKGLKADNDDKNGLPVTAWGAVVPMAIV